MQNAWNPRILASERFEASIFPKNIHFFATLLEHVGKELQLPGPKTPRAIKTSGCRLESTPTGSRTSVQTLKESAELLDRS